MNKRSFILPILLGLNLLAPCPPGNVMAETAKQLYDKAIGLGKEGRCEEAVKLLQKASENEPQTMAVTISLSFATDCSAGNLAKDVAKTIFASTSAGNGGDWSTALSLAKKACDLAPKYAPGFVHLGVVYAQMVLSNKGDNYASDAIKSYSRAIEIDANNGFAHYNIGVAYAAQHKWSMAKEHLSKASSLGIRIPGDVMARVQSEAASGEKKQETKKESIISSLWPFGSEGWICKHMYPSAYTETERNFWNAIGGCTRGK
ncbi:MAG: tetratricopeptide repeat protein [Deltaproteobacteria bacterium]|nr:tetratricopeptide repeat protein [Deltaproteobacteria bacterium]